MNNCPACGSAIAAADINVAEGVALCSSCGKLSTLSEVAAAGRPVNSILNSPPSGCTVQEHGGEIEVRISARSLGNAVGASFAAVFWNGILSVFLAVIVVGVYAHVFGSPPSWLPFSGAAPPLPFILGMFVFLIPFMGIGLILIGTALVCMTGSIRVLLRGETGIVLVGVGRIGWRRRFHAGQVKAVKLGETTWKQNDQSLPVVCIEADRTIRFGSILSEARREWARAALAVLLVYKDAGQREQLVQKPYRPHDFRAY